MSNVICSCGLCTACGACENICPEACVKRENGPSSITMVKGEQCIGCGLCEEVCPGNTVAQLYEPLTAYAAHSMDAEIRRKSASGGIAFSLYRYCLDNGYQVVGAEVGEGFMCHLKITDDASCLEKFQNSKYTYSFSDRIYQEVQEKLAAGNKVLFVGLPCQVSAMYKFLKIQNINTDRLIAADLVCHGTPHPDYFSQHVRSIEKRYALKAAKIYFRDPRYTTSRFAFSLYEENANQEATPWYVKLVEDDDLYQIGYHSALIYRDVCYSCRYAQIARCGDITLGDYHAREPDLCGFDTENVSLILVNTEKGKKLIRDAVDARIICVKKRPIEEPRDGEPQLRHPSIAGPERTMFVEAYAKSHDFEQAAGVAFRKIVIRKRLKIDRLILQMKIVVKKLITPAAYMKLKQIIKGS